MQRVFYGVQGTGNGHITRARVMAKALKAAGFEVDFMFTGRPFDKYFDMAVFGEYQLKTGCTFSTRQGQVSYLNTLLQAQPRQWLKDIRALDLRDYDVVISDFEPVTAWAARNQGKPVLGIGHQYAFQYPIPRGGQDPLAEWILRNFAPVTTGIGLHWHHFGQPILPPIIEIQPEPELFRPNKIVVYLPFEDTRAVISQLAIFEHFEFHLYAPQPVPSEYPHIVCKGLSREGFQADLHDCAGIISNAGFELASEALLWGKKILLKPLHRQMEQLANAAAIQQLDYGHTMHDLNPTAIGNWLQETHALQISYPCVAEILVQWLLDGQPVLEPAWFEQIWRRIEVRRIERAGLLPI